MFKFGGAAGGSNGILNVIQQQCSAAVEFEIEIAFVSFGLYKEFHAAVATDGVLIMRVHAADVSIFDAEEHVQLARVIHDLGLCARAMIGAARMEVGNIGD